MATISPQLQAVLIAHGLSNTKPRRLVYDYLSRHEPLNMHELIAALPQVDRSSVYRAVGLFEQLGVAQRLRIGWKYKIELSNAYQEHHHHLTCVLCGNTTLLPEDQQLEKRLHELARAQHFQAQDHQLEIGGLCQSCQP